MFTRKQLDALVAIDTDPAVTILMPTHVAGRETRQGPIRLDNLVKGASTRLQERGMRRGEADAVLAPARDLIADLDFWRHTDLGLALFLGRGVFHCHRVPLDLGEEVVIARRFHVTPLLPLLDATRFRLVTTTADETRLYDAAPGGLVRLPTPDMPQGLRAIMEESSYELNQKVPSPARPQLHKARHAGGQGFPVQTPSDQGLGQSPSDTRKDMLLEYMRRAASAVERTLAGDTAIPMVVAGTPEMAGHFRSASKARNLVEPNLDVDPDSMGEAELYEAAKALLSSQRPDMAGAAVEQVRSLLDDGDDRATTKADEIVRAARYGRVDSLIVADGARLWGTYAEDRDTVEAHGRPLPGDEDLLNYAAIHTLRAGGGVRVVPRGMMPGGALMAVTMRYGFDPNATFEKGPG